MATHQRSGDGVLKLPADAVMLATPAGYAKPCLVRAVHEALVPSAIAVWMTQSQEDVAPAPSLVAVLDGWGHMTLQQSIAALRARLPGVPTLAIVTDAQSTLAALFAAGFHDCVEWPVALPDLAARVRARRSPASASEHCVIVVDPTRLTIQCNRVQMQLTTAQFPILNRLIESAGQWLSAAQLKESANGSRVGGTAIAAHVHAIRAKLQEQAWRLRSYRTLGYCFDRSPSVLVRASPSFRQML